MLPEYDLGGKKRVRGKYYHAYQQGHTVRIHQKDGSITTQYFTLEEGAILLDPDVREYFPDSESVNQALRGLPGTEYCRRPRKMAPKSRLRFRSR